MASDAEGTDPAHSPVDAISYGLDLDSTLNTFNISFSSNAQFDKNGQGNSMVDLDKDWKDDMGLHLLQRSMLPSRNLKCIITLTGNLRITEDYGGAMKQSVKIPLADLLLDEQKSTSEGSSENDFVLQMKFKNPQDTFTLEDNFDSFDRRKFRIGGPAIQEVKARGFQLAESEDSSLSGPVITKCSYIRITIKNWRNISDPEAFSPKVVNMIGKTTDTNGTANKIVQQLGSDKHGSSPPQRAATSTPKQPVNTKRPCSCWKRGVDGGSNENAGAADGDSGKHSDACDSHWAALFGDYVQENKLKQARAGTGGMMASRWATGA